MVLLLHYFYMLEKKKKDSTDLTAGSVALRSLGALVLVLPLLLEVVVAGGWLGVNVDVGCTAVEMLIPAGNLSSGKELTKQGQLVQVQAYPKPTEMH